MPAKASSPASELDLAPGGAAAVDRALSISAPVFHADGRIAAVP